MRRIRKIRIGSRLTTLVLAASALTLTISIIMFPKHAFEASLQGLHTWWEIVFPALLPFLILLELMIGFGLMHFLGVLIEPLMRTVFRLPGTSGWAISMSAAAGFAAGAQTTARLREQDSITRSEGEHLLALAYLCSPVFIITVVAAGFFRNVQLGWPFVIIHLVSWVIAGFILRLFTSATSSRSIATIHKHTEPHNSIFRRAVQSMVQAHHKDGRGFGQLLGDSVTRSIQTMMMIGGFMMLFSVIIAILQVTNILPVTIAILARMLAPFEIPIEVIQAMLSGLFELHLGSHAASAAHIPPAWQAAAVSTILAWGGLSVHAQVKGITFNTDLTLKLYMFTRFLHGVLAFVLTMVLWEPLLRWFGMPTPSWAPQIQYSVTHHHLLNWWHYGLESLIWAGAVLGILLIGSVYYRLLKSG